MRDTVFKKKLLNSLSNSYPEIRFVKEQQFRTTYYALLLFAAVIALFQIDVRLPPKLFEIVRWGSIGIVFLLAFVSVTYQVNHLRSLQEYRRGLPEMETKSLKGKKEQLRAKLLQTLWYSIPFILLSALGAFAAAIVIFFDSRDP